MKTTKLLIVALILLLTFNVYAEKSDMWDMMPNSDGKDKMWDMFPKKDDGDSNNMWDMFSEPMEQMEKMMDEMPMMDEFQDMMPMDDFPMMDEMVDNMKSTTSIGKAAAEMEEAGISEEEIKKQADKDIAKMDKDQDIVKDQYYTDLIKVMKKIPVPNNLKLDVKVYWSPYLYVFTLANGAIRVNHGVIEKLNDDELLFVMAHEVAHLINDDYFKSHRNEHNMHAFEKMLNMGGESMGSMSSGVMASVTSEMRKSRFQKHEEFKADEFAMKVLHKHGISRDAAVDALELLQYLDAPLLKMHPTGHGRIKNIEDNYDKKCRKIS
jgi:putative metalloprotease